MTVVPLPYDADMLSDGLLVTGEHAAMSSGGHDSWERRWLWSGGRRSAPSSTTPKYHDGGGLDPSCQWLHRRPGIRAATVS